MKSVIAKISVFILSVLILSCVVYADSEYKIIAEKITLDDRVIQIEDNLYIPLRSVSQSLGAEVFWRETDKSAVILIGKDKITIRENSNYIVKNDRLIKIKNLPENFSGRLYLEVNDLTGLMGYIFKADRFNKLISIEKSRLMEVHFLDCNQADSIFIILPDGKCMLIDSGTPDFAQELIDFIKKRGYNKIDYLIGTHPHIDHIGSMADVIENFDIGTFYTIDRPHSTNSYLRMTEAIKKKNCEVVYIKRGSKILNDSVKCTVLSPDDTPYIRINNSSAVIKIEYKDISFLLSGDAEAAAEQNIMLADIDLKSTVLKVGHHGSVSSTTLNYLSAINPKIAIISVGKNNDYGYPSEYVLNLIKKIGAEIYRTDINGNIKIETNGENISIETQK